MLLRSRLIPARGDIPKITKKRRNIVIRENFTPASTPTNANTNANASKKRKYEEMNSVVDNIEHVFTPLNNKKIHIEQNTEIIKIKPVYVLVFDVETTDLFNKKTPIDKYPYITQISMIVYDIQNKKIERTYNQYIKIPQNIEIPEIVTKITGITREICDEKGISIIDALNMFYSEYSSVKSVIAHNIDFDRNVLMGEFYRNRNDPGLLANKWEELYIFRDIIPSRIQIARAVGGYDNKKYNNFEINKNEIRKMYCTMKESQFLCMIRMKNGFIKYPKLIETFRYFFPNEPEPQNLHNSLIDTFICLRCFVMMKWREDITCNIDI